MPMPDPRRRQRIVAQKDGSVTVALYHAMHYLRWVGTLNSIGLTLANTVIEGGTYDDVADQLESLAKNIRERTS